MTKFTLRIVVCVIAASVALGFSPPPTLAQRGGHGGGGGFHGGAGGGFHAGVAGRFHAAGGGHYGYTGGHGAYGWRGGYSGWHGGYWGYPRYGWGWGLGFGFGWPYWGWGWGYPYGFGYSPWYYAPYRYYCPPGYTCPRNGNGDPPPANRSPKSGSNPSEPWGPPASTPNEDRATPNVTTVASRAPILSTEKINVTAISYRAANSITQQNSRLRPEVQSAMRALREMPPFARQREIETGRYRHFSPEDRELLRSVN